MRSAFSLPALGPALRARKPVHGRSGGGSGRGAATCSASAPAPPPDGGAGDSAKRIRTFDLEAIKAAAQAERERRVTIRFLPSKKTAEVKAGDNIMNVADSLEVRIDRDCLTGLCNRCAVELEGFGPVLACGAQVGQPPEGYDEVVIRTPSDAVSDADATVEIYFTAEDVSATATASASASATRCRTPRLSLTRPVQPGQNLMSVADRAGVEIPRSCLVGSCYQCEVEVDGELVRHVSSPDPFRAQHLRLWARLTRRRQVRSCMYALPDREKVLVKVFSDDDFWESAV